MNLKACETARIWNLGSLLELVTSNKIEELNVDMKNAQLIIDKPIFTMKEVSELKFYTKKGIELRKEKK